MRGVLVILVCLVVVFSLPISAFSQVSRYRLPTQTELQLLNPATSFRGAGQQRGFGDAGQMRMPGELQPPGLGGTVVAGMGEAGALMGSGYQVHVLGEVRQPGTYFVTASSRLLEVIQRAGGVAENGSERSIDLRRKGGGIAKVDLLAFRLKGHLDDNPYITDNDVVFVPLRDKVVQVAGAVKRPDFYEIKDERTLADIVDLSGGFNAAAAVDQPLRVVRFADGKKLVEEVSQERDAMAAFEVQSGDVIVVPNLVTKGTKFDYNIAAIPGDQPFYPSYEDRVFVLGGVAFPGAYQFSPYYTVSQYISLAGGLTDRGVPKYKVIAVDGGRHRARDDNHVNPGDTIMVKESWMSPSAWIGFVMGIASFGLSTSTTVLALTK